MSVPRARQIGQFGRVVGSLVVVEISPALKFLFPAQRLELSLADAERLGIAEGESVHVSQNGTSLTATAAIRSGVTAGTAFLAEGIASDSANVLTEPVIEVRKS